MGRRGAALLAFAFTWGSIGFGILINGTRTPPPPLHLHELLPLWVRASLWFGGAGAAIFAASRRTPDGDAIGFIALIVAPIVRAFSYVWAWVMHLIGPAGTGSPTGLAAACIWIGVIALVLVVAGWAEPRGEAGRREDDS